jgi:hypothetical protein
MILKAGDHIVRRPVNAEVGVEGPASQKALPLLRLHYSLVIGGDIGQNLGWGIVAAG